MKNLEIASQVSGEIRALALRAMKGFSSSQSAYHIARRRAACPIDYMRYAEFDAILRDFEISSQVTVLDVSSPQWLSLYLANRYPDIEFCYINIIDSELNPYEEIARALSIKNLRYQKGDVRDMDFSDGSFDRIISVSVIEHVYPEEGGDLKAIREIKRVLKSGGEFLMTIPYKSKCNVVYRDGPVYERNAEGIKFYAREYDQKLLDKLIEKSGLSLAGSWYICEREGFFPVDYYEWGPGKNDIIAKYLVRSRRLLERILGISFDKVLAKQYLSVSREITGRLVNISARLRKA